MSYMFSFDTWCNGRVVRGTCQYFFCPEDNDNVLVVRIRFGRYDTHDYYLIDQVSNFMD